ncbi:MAG: hypothetical protein WCE63_01005 [Acidobacteriaceae bacterium]
MSTQKLDEIVIGRAKNALLSFFERRLSVPKIYLDANWEGQKVDVLAIDRDGVGDLSIALIAEMKNAPDESNVSKDLTELFLFPTRKLQSLPAHFKYVVAISNDADKWESSDMGRNLAEVMSKFPLLYAPDGVGRIGHILIDFRGERPNISMPISPERFRSTKHMFELADEFIPSHTADFEVRT